MILAAWVGATVSIGDFPGLRAYAVPGSEDEVDLSTLIQQLRAERDDLGGNSEQAAGLQRVWIEKSRNGYCQIGAGADSSRRH